MREVRWGGGGRGSRRATGGDGWRSGGDGRRGEPPAVAADAARGARAAARCRGRPCRRRGGWGAAGVPRSATGGDFEAGRHRRAAAEGGGAGTCGGGGAGGGEGAAAAAESLPVVGAGGVGWYDPGMAPASVGVELVGMGSGGGGAPAEEKQRRWRRRHTGEAAATVRPSTAVAADGARAGARCRAVLVRVLWRRGRGRRGGRDAGGGARQPRRRPPRSPAASAGGRSGAAAGGAAGLFTTAAGGATRRAAVESDRLGGGSRCRTPQTRRWRPPPRAGCRRRAVVVKGRHAGVAPTSCTPRRCP
ncbi:hypothetical protein BU14_0126s0026 [Porphyra umbilicalis]|uniref:Uncharacterized protein n=1 Tax=Porphyra umbilicalis TaxID=2786 RepID=A0A1X6PAX1_PORUM|nr:hypothetical protein BU14_0126s0026 [Porphyra umbilicalis]|eukprot:OSX77987.1 hypothetical protein BU14_0126s0026 [Porphyra umbilicalis]